INYCQFLNFQSFDVLALFGVRSDTPPLDSDSRASSIFLAKGDVSLSDNVYGKNKGVTPSSITRPSN
ncbi:hypothetical protein, partial [Yersinia pestis]|uniref:hypothetical protein n=1 Tax=Yersinia pestis TaxID=632 RepID=UPI003B513971